MIQLHDNGNGERSALLPDGKHKVVIWRHSSAGTLCRVVRYCDGHERLRFTIPAGHLDTEDLIIGFCEKAEKKFPKQLRYKRR